MIATHFQHVFFWVAPPPPDSLRRCAFVTCLEVEVTGGVEADPSGRLHDLKNALAKGFLFLMFRLRTSLGTVHARHFNSLFSCLLS